MSLENFEVIPILPFQRQAKRLIKKFPSIKSEAFELIESLKKIRSKVLVWEIVVTK